MSSRRDVLQSLVAGVVAVPAAALAKGDATPEDAAAAKAGQGAAAAQVEPHAPWALLAPLLPNSELPLGWRVEALTKVERGAAVLTLLHESGGHATVHLCRNGGRPVGIGYSKHVDMVLMNGGKGDRPTEESIGRVLMAIATRIDANGAQLEGALTHAERVSRYGEEALR